MTRVRVRTLGALFAAVLMLGACATKRDVRTIQQQMQQMQDRQAALLRDIQQQNRLLLDSIRATMSMTQDVRGATTNQLRQFEQSVSQLGNLVGQLMGSLTRIEQRLNDLEQKVTTPVAPASTGGGNPDSLYNEGMLRMSDLRFSTARLIFEQLVEEHPNHEKASEAQFQIGQSYYLEKNFTAAYSELEKVAQRWAQAPRAPAALARAAAIAEEQKDIPKARAYYEQIRANYAGTDEARAAARKLQQLPRRE